jgi:putative oxidoreductase
MGEIDVFALFIAVPVVILTVVLVLIAAKDDAPDPDRIERGDLSAALGLHSRREWALTIGFTLVFIVTGVHLLTGLPQALAMEALIGQFEAWGYSQEFRLFIGATELLAAIFLIPPATASLAAAYLAVLMAGAIYTHVAAGAWALAIVPLVFLIGLLYLAALRAPWAFGRRAPIDATL